MGDAITAGKISAKGSFHLFLGLAISNVIMAAGTVIIGSPAFLGEEKYGIYAAALMPLTLLTLFRDFGINSAIVKYVAQYRSENKTSQIRHILASGMLFKLISGVLFSIITFLLADFLSVIYGRPEIKSLIEIASITLLAGSLTQTAQSVFTGFERMEFNSFLWVGYSIIKTLLVVFLVLLGYGAGGAVLGQTIALVINGVLAALIFFFFFYRRSKRTNKNELKLSKSLIFLLKYGFPLYISTISTGFLTAFLSFIMPIYCSNLLISNYRMAINFSVIITFFTVPITTVLFPAFSKLSSEKGMKTLKIMFQSSIKYTALVTIPVTAAVMALSEPLVFTLLPDYGNTPLFLTLFSITFLYAGLGNLSLGNFLNGQGKTKVTMILNLISVGIGVPLGFFLTSNFRIVGLIATTLVATLPSLFIGLIWAKKHFDVSVEWVSSTKIFLASGVAGAIAYVVVSWLQYSAWMELAVGGVVFLGSYMIAVPLIAAIDKNDVGNLRNLLRALGPIFSLINPFLKIIEKLLSVFSSSNSD
jgi:stage V sporulation protein B